VLILTNRSQEGRTLPIVSTDCLLSPFSAIELQRQYLQNYFTYTQLHTFDSR
jgi:hypothetical protein